MFQGRQEHADGILLAGVECIKLCEEYHRKFHPARKRLLLVTRDNLLMSLVSG
jgi:hypothetical protein